MRKLLLLAVLAMVPSCAFAQGFYGEIGVGLDLLQDTDTEPFSLIPTSGPFQGSTLAGTMHADYSSPQGTVGAELGIAAGRWRFGVSYDWASANIDSADFVGTFNGKPLNTLTEDDFALLGIDTSAGIQIVAGNVYFNLAPPGSPIQPYLGIGAGAGIVQNASTELALTASAGARFAISSNAYIGARYRFTHISGPETDLGIKFDDITFHTVSVQLGFYFGSF